MVRPRNLGRVGQGPANPVKDWLESLPPVTRVWFVASFGTTCLISFGLVDPYRLLWSWPAVRHRFEVWRLITPYFFFGGFSFPFLINLYLLQQYSKGYEISPYNTGGGGDTADYIWMMFLGALMLCGVSEFMGQVAPAQAMLYLVLYVWSRRNPTQQVSLYGFPVQAVMLPWALCAFNMVIGNSLLLPLMGIGVGHLYYFADRVLPDAVRWDVVKTPRALIDARRRRRRRGARAGSGRRRRAAARRRPPRGGPGGRAGVLGERFSSRAPPACAPRFPLIVTGFSTHFSARLEFRSPGVLSGVSGISADRDASFPRRRLANRRRGLRFAFRPWPSQRTPRAWRARVTPARGCVADTAACADAAARRARPAKKAPVAPR